MTARKIESEPMTLWDLEQHIKQARAYGAEDYDPIFVDIPVKHFAGDECIEEFTEQMSPVALRLEKHGRRELWLR